MDLILIPPKKCRCGKVHVEVKAKVNELGYWFDCECGSTLMVPFSQGRTLKEVI